MQRTVRVIKFPLKNTTTYSTVLSSTGTSMEITVNGSAAGGTGSYTYEFYYKKDGASSWSKFNSSALTATTASLAINSGKYIIRVYVKDGKSTELKDLEVAFDLTNTSTVSKTTTFGKIIVVTGSAIGGSGGYTYQFYYKKDGDAEWSKFDDSNKTDTTATLKPSSEGKYIIRTYVTDSSGKTKRKDLNVEFLKITSKDYTENNDTIFEVIVEGGTGEYVCEFEYKSFGEADEAYKPFDVKYVNGNKVTFKSGSVNSLAGVYVVRVTIKDGENNQIGMIEANVNIK